MRWIGAAWLAALIAASGGAASGGTGLRLESPAFVAGGPIPAAHTCDGAGGSPPLAWSEVPSGTRSFALIVHDPDAPAGDWLHWLAWNIPAEARGLPAGVAAKGSLPDGTRQGRNDFGDPGYGGPCPPGGTHRYVFGLYALDTPLSLGPGASREDLERAIDGHTLGRAELTGRYERRRR